MKGKMTKVEQLRREVLRLKFRKGLIQKQVRRGERARSMMITRMLSASRWGQEPGREFRP